MIEIRQTELFAECDVLVVLLCGGDKSSQSEDIAEAIALARQLEEDP